MTSFSIEVKIEDETVWLILNQIVELFESSKGNIREHLKNIFLTGELTKESTVRKFRTVQQEVNRKVPRSIEFYNLDAIISVGYRVNTIKGVHDPFLIIDNQTYPLGASLKDLGKKLFAFIKMETSPDYILDNIKFEEI